MIDFILQIENIYCLYDNPFDVSGPIVSDERQTGEQRRERDMEGNGLNRFQVQSTYCPEGAEEKYVNPK
jgi:hypothetical protein